MKNIRVFGFRLGLWTAVAVPLLVFALACGPGEEPTPTTAPTATATSVPTQVGTPTSVVGPVATPTPSTVATPTPPTAEQPRRGGRMVWFMNYAVQHYDPQQVQATTILAYVTGKLYNNLFYNPGGDTVECEICTEWHLENGGKTMVFNMIQGIKFHNGQEMTSADVKWSLRKMMGEVDGLISVRTGGIKEYIDSIETPSRYVLRLNLIRPSPFIPKVLTITHGGVLYPEGTTFNDLQTAPRGSGPFLLKEVVIGTSWKMDRNPNYFKPGLPYLDGEDVAYVADATTIMANFLTHKIQVLGDTSEQYAPTLTKLRDEGKLNFRQQVGSGYAAVLLVHTKPPFNDVRMRKAVNLALDRKALMKVMYPIPGLGRAQLLYFPEPMDYSIPESQIWDVEPGWGTGAKKAQEIEEAKKLVVDAGYPKGIDIVQMYRPVVLANVQETLQQMVGVVGIKTKIDTVVNPVVWQAHLDALDYQFHPYSFSIPTQDADEIVGGYWITGASRNQTGYSSKEVDRLFPLMSGELNPTKRKELFSQIRDIIIRQDMGHVPLPTGESWLWWWPTFGGFIPGRDGVSFSSSGVHRGDRHWLKE